MTMRLECWSLSSSKSSHRVKKIMHRPTDHTLQSYRAKNGNRWRVKPGRLSVQSNFFCISLIIIVWSSPVNSENATWTSEILHDDVDIGTSVFRARAVSVASGRFMLVAVEKQDTTSLMQSVLLYKTDLSGRVVWWVREASTVDGTPFDMAFNPRTGIAYIVISESSSSGNNAKGHIVRFSNISTQSSEESEYIEESLFYTTPGNVGKSKLFACALHPTTGELYVIGATSTSMYRQEALGKGDVIVARLGSSGETLASRQFGSRDNDVGKAISISADGSYLMVGTQRQLSSRSTTSEVYRLDIEDLDVVEGPHSPYNHGAEAFYNPKSMAVWVATGSETNSYISFVAGDALVKPARKQDIYIHLYGEIGGQVSDVTVAYDGASDGKQSDSCVSIHVGNDGNAYCVGYTESSNRSVSSRMNLMVISPTGELVYRSEQTANDSEMLLEAATGSVMIDQDSGRKLIYVGYGKVKGRTVSTMGCVRIGKNEIREFGGFGEVVKGAGVDPWEEKGSSAGSTAGERSMSFAAMIGASFAGCVGVAAIIGGLIVIRRGRDGPGDLESARGHGNSDVGDERDGGQARRGVLV